VLSSSPPRLITTGRIVPIGTSGGLTVLGTRAALAGALFIGALAAILATVATANFSASNLALASKFFLQLPTRWIALSGIGAVSGVLGALFDSLLGATVQAIYYCDYDQKETERRVHACGRVTRLRRGFAWLDNDAVNFLASMFGSAMAAGLWLLL
jgi:uncharacterized membrane protein